MTDRPKLRARSHFRVVLPFCVGLLLCVGAPTSAEAAVEGVPCTAEPTDMPIVYGDLITCAIDVIGDTDVFRFFGSTGETVVIRGTWQTGTMRPCVQLIAPDTSPGEACANSFSNRIDTTLTQTGTYTIRLRDVFGINSGMYAVSLESVLPPSPTAQPITYGTTVEHEINVAGDTDLFTFVGVAGDSISIVGTWQSGTMRPCVELIAPDNSHAEACANSFSNTLNITLNLSGPYTVLVRDVFSINIGNYALDLQCLAGSCPANVPPSMSLSLTGCTVCQAGNQFTVQARLKNPGSTSVEVELKLGLRLPDATPVSLLGPGGLHLVIPLPAGLDTTFPVLNIPWPGGLPAGTWTFEGTLLEVPLGKTFSRDVRPFQVVP